MVMPLHFSKLLNREKDLLIDFVSLNTRRKVIAKHIPDVLKWLLRSSVKKIRKPVNFIYAAKYTNPFGYCNNGNTEL